ncbi:hypothetical protein [Nocardia sp. X0981]
MPAPLSVGPFAAEAHPNKARRAFPSFVVGDRDEEDLVLARTLLGAVLSGVGSAHDPEWAVAVLRTRGGPVVLLTSTEGRGWLPPGLFLPSEVSIPWRWDAAIGRLAKRTTAALEGTTDPARMLAEFGMLMAHPGRIWLSAVASSVAIPVGLRDALQREGVALEGAVPAAEAAVDLSSPGDGLVDRLALAGSDTLQGVAAAVPDREIRAKCFELARLADARVRAAVPASDTGSTLRRAHREQILDAFRNGQAVPTSWWEQLRAEDDITAVTLSSQRVDVSHIPVGAVPVDLPGAETVRATVFERRADEMLMLLARGEPDRQTLRDMLYTYGQIVEHPQWSAVASVAAPEVRPIPSAESAHSFEPISRGAVSVAVGDSFVSVPVREPGPAGAEDSAEQRRA